MNELEIKNRIDGVRLVMDDVLDEFNDKKITLDLLNAKMKMMLDVLNKLEERATKI